MNEIDRSLNSCKFSSIVVAETELGMSRYESNELMLNLG